MLYTVTPRLRKYCIHTGLNNLIFSFLFSFLHSLLLCLSVFLCYLIFPLLSSSKKIFFLFSNFSLLCEGLFFCCVGVGVGVVGHRLCGSCHTWVCVMPWGLCGFLLIWDCWICVVGLGWVWVMSWGC